MHRPDHFRVEDIAQMHGLMRARPFAALVRRLRRPLWHAFADRAEGRRRQRHIECHLARANPHWKDLAEGGEALMIFQGAEGLHHAQLVSVKAQHGKAVPTWNYRDRPCLRLSRR